MSRTGGALELTSMMALRRQANDLEQEKFDSEEHWRRQVSMATGCVRSHCRNPVDRVMAGRRGMRNSRSTQLDTDYDLSAYMAWSKLWG